MVSNEMLGKQIASIHNLGFYMNLMKLIVSLIWLLVFLILLKKLWIM